MSDQEAKIAETFSSVINKISNEKSERYRKKEDRINRQVKSLRDRIVEYLGLHQDKITEKFNRGYDTYTFEIPLIDTDKDPRTVTYTFSRNSRIAGLYVKSILYNGNPELLCFRLCIDPHYLVTMSSKYDST